MYAVIDLSGKQQRVEKNEIIRIEKVSKNIGDEVEFDKIMMLQDENGEVKIGTPYLNDIKVTAKVLAQDRAKKIIVFKKKRRKSYTKTQGHRQYYTEIKIQDIISK
ncbi:MAG: 50S ribosomal protein L21 [Elusimicrobiota bacterium]|jgi:large subunit ribosomal protein L21|nr:50S ribosomal protein L21 [Elusimicrobiota bacterium]